MDVDQFKNKLVQNSKTNNLTLVELIGGVKVEFYPRSLNEKSGCLFLIGRENGNKFLYLFSSAFDKGSAKDFTGDKEFELPGKVYVKRCCLNHQNVLALQKIFPFTKVVVIGLTNSFGFGDRLGLANAGHLRAQEGSKFKPILAQQSIRELTRTQRKPEDVMDAAVWAVFQEGYRDGFGADADHLKTFQDIDLMVDAGYKTFTFDPGEYVNNEADHLDEIELKKKVMELPWQELKDNSASLVERYADKTLEVMKDFQLHASANETLKAAVKYNRAILHINNLYNHLKSKLAKGEYEVEVSVDETDSVTTPFEHFFIANELKRLNVEFVSLAPRFIGDFEKGIDYKGDLKIFKAEYEKHAKIANYFGTYKLSLHSGSDKFSAYKVIGSLNIGFTHVKTAGTSYLEALKVVAIKQPELFRKILDYSSGLYETEKKSYHVSADVNKVGPAKNYKDNELERLFSSNDARQILHVTYGRVLTDKDARGNYLFRNEIYKCLTENEELHYSILIKHFHKHLEPFKN